MVGWNNNGRPNHIESALIVIHTGQWFTWTDSKNKIYANLRLTESAGIGNVFFVGKLFSDFEVLKTEIQNIQKDQNVLELQQEILENSYRIKSLRLELDGEFK